MTKKDLTEVVLIVDRSGSMCSVAEDMEGGMREFVKSQVEDPGETKITYTRFDGIVEHILDNVSSNEVALDSLVLQPRGSTALLDGIGHTLVKVGNRLSITPEDQRPSLVVVVIVTDGGENSSSEYKYEQIKDLIELQKNKYNWQFVFLGANQDSFAVGQSLGVDYCKISNYAMSRSKEAMSSGASSMVRGLKAAMFSGIDYSSVEYLKEDRDALNE